MKLTRKFREIPYAGLAALKLAASVVPESLGKQALRREFARKLVGMRGIPMKMAQVMAMSGDQASALLQQEALATVTAAPVDEIKARLVEMAPALFSKVREFSGAGIAASLGQVHKVSLQDGRICALKVKHSGIAAAMDLDSGLMAFLVSVFGHFREGFAVDTYQELLTRELRWELDYPYEIARQERIWKEFRDRPAIIIPRPYPSESGMQHLLMDWEESQTIADFSETASEAERMQAARNLAEFHLRTFFKLGMAHADPNPGNFGLRRGAAGIELVVYDFGSLVPLDACLVRGFAGLLAAAGAGKDPYPCLIEMGFKPEPLSAIRTKLPDLCGILLEPFFSRGNFRLGEWDRSRRVKDLLGAERWNLMIAAPPEMFFLMRAFHGLFHYSDKIGEFPDLKLLIGEFLTQAHPGAGADPESGLGKEENDLPPLGAPSHGRAQHLRIKVVNNGETTVSLTMPWDAVLRLEEIIDPEVISAIRAQGIDISDSQAAARRNDFRPMELFSCQIGTKNINIWLA